MAATQTLRRESVKWRDLPEGSGTRYTGGQGGVASAAKPRRAAALAGLGREGRLADAPHSCQGPLPRLYGAPACVARILCKRCKPLGAKETRPAGLRGSTPVLSRELEVGGNVYGLYWTSLL